MLESIKLYTEKARSSKATVEDMNKLERKLDEAIKDGFPSALLFEGQNALENLRDRVFTVSINASLIDFFDFTR